MAIIQADFFSKLLKRIVPFNMILPIDSVIPSPKPQALPLKTLYLLHGYMGGVMDLFGRFSLGEFAEQNNLAIVMPDGENHFYTDDTQRNDLYGEFIGRELIEFTRLMFPLSDKREDTIIGGISMGGYGALINGLKYNDVFSRIIAISPAIITHELKNATEEPDYIGCTSGFYESVFGDLTTAAERDTDPFFLSEKLAREKAIFPNIYFACGCNDRLVHTNRKLDSHLTALNIPHIYEENEGTHDNLFFTPHLIKALSGIPLTRNPIPPNPFWIENPK